VGTKGTEIVGLDVKKLVDTLNRALSDEWLAYYQYWVGAKVIKGPMRDAVMAELVQHSIEELSHAELVSNRIVELGGIPVLSTEEWPKLTNCKYEAPSDPKVMAVLAQNIRGEQCAIGVYKALSDLTMGKDHVTYNMAVTIMTQEVQHEEDLQNLVEDIEIMTQMRK